VTLRETKLREKTVLLTGASTGIGASLARRLGREGATVLLLARTEAKLRAEAEEVMAAGGQAHVYPVDLYDKEATAAIVEQVRSAHGVPDVIVNNAGAGHWVEIDKQGVEEAEQALALPLLAAIRMTLPFLPGMVARGSGVVVNITSPGALTAIPGAGMYGVARSAMRSFHETLHEDLRGTGVRGLLVNAAEVSSDYFKVHADSHARVPTAARVLLGSATPEQVADAIVAALGTKRTTLYVPLRFALLRPLFQHAPWFIRFLGRSTGWQRQLPPPADDVSD